MGTERVAIASLLKKESREMNDDRGI